MNKHKSWYPTPGPWKANVMMTSTYSDEWAIKIKKGRLVIAEVPCKVFSSHRANARLIAAAPELLEALKVVIDDLMYKDHARVIDLARAVIAKAESPVLRMLDTGRMPEEASALKAALTEPTVPSDCPDSHQTGCERCRSPLWAGTKCDVCGRKA